MQKLANRTHFDVLQYKKNQIVCIVYFSDEEPKTGLLFDVEHWQQNAGLSQMSNWQAIQL